jgi:hypothetical protein
LPENPPAEADEEVVLVPAGDEEVPGAADEPDGPAPADDDEVPFDMPGEEDVPTKERAEEAA